MQKETSKNLKSVEAIEHDDAKRKNIPTIEFQSLLKLNCATDSVQAALQKITGK